MSITISICDEFAESSRYTNNTLTVSPCFVLFHFFASLSSPLIIGTFNIINQQSRSIMMMVTLIIDNSENNNDRPVYLDKNDICTPGFYYHFISTKTIWISFSLLILLPPVWWNNSLN